MGRAQTRKRSNPCSLRLELNFIAVPNVRVTTCVHCRKAYSTTDVKACRNKRAGGRKPPLMAEVGQSILREHNIGIVRFMQANELRSLRVCTSGRQPAMRFLPDSIDNAAFPVRWT